MTKEDLINIAKNAKKNALATTTGYKVGAALLTKSGNVYIGCNVEEYSILSLSNCAERVAIQNAISCGESEFEAIAVVGGKAATAKVKKLISSKKVINEKEEIDDEVEVVDEDCCEE